MIVLTTPTGHIGSHLLAQLRDAGAPVRAIARDPSKLPAGVDAIAGAHDDPAVLDRALPGADALFLVVPPDPATTDPHGHYVRFGEAAAGAVARHGVPRVVMVSSYGEGIDHGAGLLSSAKALEAAVNASGVATRALRPPFFMENLLHGLDGLRQGRLFLTSAPDRPLPTVATRDVAAAAAELLLDPGWTGQEGVDVVGPDDLTPPGIAAVLAEALGYDVTLAPVPLDAYRSMLVEHGASEAWAGALVEMAAAQDDGAYDRATLPARRGATSLRAWAESVLAPALR